LLSDKDGGKRLFAYAYIYARPNPQRLADLVHSATGNERTPPQIRNTLRVFLATLEKGTERYYELSKIMKALDEAP
jgi:hypothetical protein